MKGLSLIIACFLVTHALAQEEKMTSLSHTCQGEQCVEQLCNPDKTYCVDSPYTLQDNSKIPLQRNIEQDLNFFLSVIANEEGTNASNQKVQQLTLSDGSKWEMEQNFASIAKNWQGGDHISINIPHPPGGILYPKMVYNLHNESTHQGIAAKLAEADESQTKKIVSINPNSQAICLNNEMCFILPEQLSGFLTVIKPGENAILGLNTDLDSEEYPYLLIFSISKDQAKQWIHLPVKLSR